PVGIQAAAHAVRRIGRRWIGEHNPVFVASAGSEAEPKRVDGQLGKRKRRFAQGPYAIRTDFCRAVSYKATYARASQISWAPGLSPGLYRSRSRAKRAFFWM